MATNALIALALLAGVAGTLGGLTDRGSSQLVDDASVPGIIEKPPYFIDTSVKTLTVKEGDALSIDCRPGGTPNPRVEWKRQEDVLPYYGGKVYKHNKLEIPALTRKDSGHFVCRADNGVGEPAESHIILDVQYAPTVTFEKDEVFKAVGSDMKLECHVEATPSAVVTWFKDDEELEESPKTKITQREDKENRKFVSTIAFKELKEKEFGTFRCVAQNLFGKSEETISLTRKTPPVITTQSENEIVYSVAKQKLRNALPIVIECGAEGSPRPEYRWTKDNVPLIVEQSSKYSMEPETGNLLIDQPTIYDNGRYQCVAHNEYGTAVSDPVTLVNNTDVMFHNSEGSFDIEAELGRPFKLSCPKATGYPKPQLTWMKSYSPPETGEVKLEIINDERMVVDPEGNLWFTHITEDDDTSKNDFQLMCLGNNEFAPKDYSLGVLINLKVIKPEDGVANHNLRDVNVQPIPLYTSARILNFNGNGENAIWCIFGGEPTPKITWKRLDGQEIDETRFVTRNNGKTLVSKNSTMDDAGEYQCVADNGVGETQNRMFEVNVFMAPKSKSEFQSYKVDQGATVMFDCTAESSEDVTYKWYFNGHPLGMDEPTITFHNIRISHTGNYACNASNSLGHVFNQGFLLVNENSEGSGSCSEVSSLREEVISLKAVIHELKDLVTDQHKIVESNHQMLHKLTMGTAQEDESMMGEEEVTTMFPDV
ncbi:unnamed protein product [Meganyctiphanes norvegica]|uniref:Ig-like domain-containing protein n=1 Tax=Meganyctiphanes norvegica TaxID=48144 RepID=A0AAV2R6S6_MEGNR